MPHAIEGDALFITSTGDTLIGPNYCRYVSFRTKRHPMTTIMALFICCTQLVIVSRRQTWVHKEGKEDTHREKWS